MTLATVGRTSLVINSLGGLVGVVLVALATPNTEEKQEEELLLPTTKAPPSSPTPWNPLDFLRDSADMMIRSLALQGSVWSMSVISSRLGTDVLAAHHVAMLIWMLLSFVVDGFADLATMLGAAMIGAGEYNAFGRLVIRLVRLSLVTGIFAGLALCLFEDAIIKVMLATSTDDALSALHSVWLLLSVAQITNSLVFVYDGVMSAAGEFRFVRNAIVVGVILYVVTITALFEVCGGSLLNIWLAKLVLNVWRAATSVYRIHGVFLHTTRE